MSGLKALLDEIIKRNFTQKVSPKNFFIESSQIGYLNKSKTGIRNDFLNRSDKDIHSKQKKQKFDLNRSLIELDIQQPSNPRFSQGFFNHEDPSLKTHTTTTSNYLENTLKKNKIESSALYNNFSFSIAKSQLKNIHYNNITINNSLTLTRSHSKSNTRVQKQIEDINKTLINKTTCKKVNLHKPTFTEVNLNQKEYLSISPFNLRKNILSQANHLVVTQIGNIKGRNIPHYPQKKSLFDLILPKEKTGKIPLLNPKYLFEKDNTETEDFYNSFVNQIKTKNNQRIFLNFKIIPPERNYFNKYNDKMNQRSLSQKNGFKFFVNN